MKRKTSLLLLTAAATIAIAASGFGAYKFFNRDLTGYSAAEIQHFREEHPKVKVSYTVTIEGGEAPITLPHDTTHAAPSTSAQAEDLAAKSGYFPAMESIDLGSVRVTAQQLDQLKTAFPAADIRYSYTSLLGEYVPADTEELNLSHITSADLDTVIKELRHLPKLRTIELRGEDGMPTLSTDDALKLCEAYPDVHIGYALKLFGQFVTTDMERLNYFYVKIGDEGLDEFRRLMPLLDRLTYLRLDRCRTTDEAMAKFREELADRCKVSWRVNVGHTTCYTDTYMVWVNNISNDQQTEGLKYCNEVKYLDLGHSLFTNVDFMAYMPDVEMAIISINDLNDLSGIAGCTKLEYLEVFTNTDLTEEDMQHLSGLTNMKYLNISNLPKIRDLSFTDNMPQLRMLWSTMNYIDDEEIERVAALHPDCIIKNIRETGDPTEYGWRRASDGNYLKTTHLYRLVCARFGYNSSCYAYDMHNDLHEEITFESMGLTPP